MFPPLTPSRSFFLPSPSSSSRFLLPFLLSAYLALVICPPCSPDSEGKWKWFALFSASEGHVLMLWPRCWHCEHRLWLGSSDLLLLLRSGWFVVWGAEAATRADRCYSAIFSGVAIGCPLMFRRLDCGLGGVSIGTEGMGPRPSGMDTSMGHSPDRRNDSMSLWETRPTSRASRMFWRCWPYEDGLALFVRAAFTLANPTQSCG